jgi:hypothetical protein
MVTNTAADGNAYKGLALERDERSGGPATSVRRGIIL